MRTNAKLFLVALLFTMSTAAFAQVSVGVRAGVQLNNVYTTDGFGAVAPNFLTTDEANLAVVVDIPIAGGFSVQPELAFTTKGFGLKQGLDTELLGVQLPLNASAETRIKYVEMPLLAKYKFGDNAFKAYLAAGPTFGYATAGQIDTKVTALLEFDLGSVPLDLSKEKYQRFDVGATVAVGLQYDFGPISAFADARYNRGFSELYNVPIVNEKVRNSGYGFNFGLMVPIGG